MSPQSGAPNDLAAIEADALAALSELVDAAALDAWRVHYLGRKGRLTTALRGLGAIPAEERPAAGQAANRVKVALESALEDREASLAAARAAQASQKIDVTLPARPTARGQLHPVTRMRRTVERIFRDMGFAVVEGPEVEWDTYNFDRLRIPADHPARDMWDTMWIDHPARIPVIRPCCCARTHRPCKSPTWRRTSRPSA